MSDAPPQPARLSGPVTEGRLRPPVSPVRVDAAAHGYREEEYFAAGTATAFTAAGPAGADGRWTVAPDGEAPYRTRVVVHRPADEGAFSGTVLVEWCNVSGGVEAAPDWAFLHEEILRAGHAHVAVSAQALGVDGGAGLLGVPGVRPTAGLVGAAPERYGTLSHPGDRFAFDMFSQIGLALRGPEGTAALGGRPATRVVALGESQSAMFLTTYVDAVHPSAGAYDGFLVHSRGGSGASLAGTVLDEAGGPPDLWIREDVDVPVLLFQTETDLVLLGYAAARQPDSGHVRTWEVAGTAHADAYLVGPAASLFGWEEPVNDGPQAWVLRAALRALVRWITDGTPPPTRARLELASTEPPVIARDELGNARGGVRTPDVDAPVAALSGDTPPGADMMRALFGTTTRFDLATLQRLYRDCEGYRSAYRDALDRALAEGVLLEEDRPALLARADCGELPG